jgi:hypothetical protein
METHRSDDEDLGEEDARSDDSYIVTKVNRWQIDDEKRLVYECEMDDGSTEVLDRSDLMDGGPTQRMVLQIEKRVPPPWDPLCPYCDEEGCEECQCPDCERECRFLHGVNYGCPHHPVV